VFRAAGGSLTTRKKGSGFPGPGMRNTCVPRGARASLAHKVTPMIATHNVPGQHTINTKNSAVWTP